MRDYSDGHMVKTKIDKNFFANIRKEKWYNH